MTTIFHSPVIALGLAALFVIVSRCVTKLTRAPPIYQDPDARAESMTDILTNLLTPSPLSAKAEHPVNKEIAAAEKQLRPGDKQSNGSSNCSHHSGLCA